LTRNGTCLLVLAGVRINLWIFLN